jgi:hypothetical protein
MVDVGRVSPNSHRERLRLLLIGLGAFTGSGCGQILGVPDYGVSDRKPSVDAGHADAGHQFSSDVFDFKFADHACQQCSDTSCNREELACTLDADCDDWAQCRAACGRDEQCIAGCPRQVPRVTDRSEIVLIGPSPAAITYGKCLNRACHEECLARYPGVDVAMSEHCFPCCAPLLALAGQDGGADALQACADGASAQCRQQCQLTPDFDCVGHVTWPVPSVLPLLATTFQVSAFDITTFTPSAGATVGGTFAYLGGTFAACRTGVDVDCLNPLAKSGSGVFNLPETRPGAALFDYWELSGNPDYLPTLNWMTPPPVGAGSDQRGVIPVALKKNLAQFGADFDNYGFIIVDVQSCDGSTRIAGVKLEVDEASPKPGELPVSYAYPPANLLLGPDPGTQTIPGGFAAAYNVKPGSVIVRTRFADTQKKISEVPVIVRAGWVTSLILPPSPPLDAQ